MASGGGPSDAALLAAVARGDQDALETLHARYRRPVFGFCLRLVRDPVVADELVNDLFFQVWRGAARFEARSKPSTWLFGIAYHLAVNRLRGTRPLTVEPEVLDQMPDPHPSPASETVQADRARRLGQALDTLSPEHRATIELAYAQGLSCAEVAEVLRIPVNTVKTRMFYARQRLRELLPALGVEAEE